jgi:hypothetical protein
MDWVVGVLMLGLGLWGYRTAWLLRRKVRAGLVPGAYHDADHSTTFSHSHAPWSTDSAAAHAPSSSGVHVKCEHERGTAPALSESRVAPLEVDTDPAVDLVIVRAEPTAFAMRRRWPLSALSARSCKRSSRAQTSLIALGVGILHGIGGPGGVLAVLPTLLMPGPVSSVLYLFAFCFAATAVMGGVAGTYGACTYRSRDVSPNLPWVLSVISASTSVLIGLVWLVCSATGTLEQVLGSLGIE